MTTNDEESARRAAKLYEEWLQDPSTARPLEEVEAELIANGVLDEPLTTVRANYVAGLERTVAEQREAIERAMEVLETVEWADDFVTAWCIWCEESREDGHADDCPRQAALAGLRRVLGE